MNPHIRQTAKVLADRFPGLLQLALLARDAFANMEEPRDTPLGFKLAGDPQMQTGSFEPEETRIVQTIFPHVDTVINVGANIGYYSCLALSAGKHVVAFEPIAQNLQHLLRNIRANGWDERAEVFPLALSNAVGITKIYGGGTAASLIKGWAGTPEAYSSLVPTSTFDKVIGTRFNGKRCFVVVDIEGAERFMLEGASTLLDMTPDPIWLMEIAISEHQPKGVVINPHLVATFAFFWERGYEAWTADAASRRVTPEEIGAIAQTGVNTMTTHNFLFVMPGRIHDLLGVATA